MNVHFTEEQKMLQQAFREFAEEYLAPNAAKWDEDHSCPSELFPIVGELGVLGIFVPEEYGGVGLGHVERIIAMEEFGRVSAGFTTFLFAHQLAVGAMNDFGTEEQKKEYLPGMCDGSKIWSLAVTEPGGGTDLYNHKVTAEKDGDDYIINGRKCFLTNSHNCDYCIVTAKTGVNEKGRNILSAFIVSMDNEGIKPGRLENKSGMRGSLTGDMILTNCRVPASAMLGADGKGAQIALKEIGEIGRASMSAICVGIMKACIEEGVKFANDRIIYGKPLAKIQAIQWHIAEMRLNYEIGRALIYRAACYKDEGQATTLWNGMAKLFGTRAAVESAQHCIELMGGYGVITEYPVDRYMRDALAAISPGGTNEVHKMVIAADTLKTFA